MQIKNHIKKHIKSHIKNRCSLPQCRLLASALVQGIAARAPAQTSDD